MELTQPAASDSEFLRLDHANKKHSRRRHSKNKSQFITRETESDSKSLRSDWEKTLAKKEKTTSPNRTVLEGDFRLSETPQKEIRLHVEAEDIHEGLQQDDRPDPIWEPWKPKESITTVMQPEEVVAPIEHSAVVEEEPTPVPSNDPALAAEALLHSRAVANIAEEHAQRTTSPSYKDQLPKEAQDIMDRLQPARDHHIEQSAWHNIEVDNITGRAAEEPTFSYGEAFLNEQKTETNAFHTDEGVASASGQLAVSTPIFDNLNDKDAAILSNTQPIQTLPIAPQSQAAFRPPRSNIDPLLWTILTVIVFAIFLALLI